MKIILIFIMLLVIMIIGILDICKKIVVVKFIREIFHLNINKHKMLITHGDGVLKNDVCIDL